MVANLVELPRGLPSKILRVNLLSCVKMIELIVPGMIRRNSGIVVNIASITANALPAPLLHNPKSFFRVGGRSPIFPRTQRGN
jgi:NAD(P)-dependent dehydrogenase (short-subunit alcohol dehydrogenase family)